MLVIMPLSGSKLCITLPCRLQEQGGHEAHVREGAQWGQAGSLVRGVRSMRPSGGHMWVKLFRNKRVNSWAYGKTTKQNRYGHDALDLFSGDGVKAI